MATLEVFGVKAPKLKTAPKRASLSDLRVYIDEFVRVRKLLHLMDKYTNVDIDWIGNCFLDDDEWPYVLAVRRHRPQAVDDWVEWDVVAYLLCTKDKAEAVRRAYGWGLRREDGPVSVEEAIEVAREYGWEP